MGMFNQKTKSTVSKWKGIELKWQEGIVAENKKISQQRKYERTYRICTVLAVQRLTKYTISSIDEIKLKIYSDENE